ncbi:MAG: cation transporter, partial [Steroidobacteraceae bacterium]
MDNFSSVSSNDKQRLLAITLGMEVYTIVASSIAIFTSNSLVFVANLVIATTGALASGFSLYTVRRMSGGADLKNSYGFGRLEVASAITVGLMMIMAVMFIGLEIVKKLSEKAPQEGGGIGIALTCVSLLV